MDDLSAISSVNLSNQISVTVAKKVMDSEKEQGMAMVEMIRQAMPPEARGGNQGRLDVYA